MTSILPPKKELTLGEVKAAMLRMLKESGLDADDAKLMRVEPLTAQQVTREAFTKFIGAGFRIPYFDFAGKVSKEFFRFRYVEDITRDSVLRATHKKLRYVQPSGVLPRVYWAPHVPWRKLFDSEEAVYITEGEKKAACGCKNEFATIGLGGVWSFRSAKENIGLIPELADLNWNNRRVYIVYDSDARSNRNVMLAEAELGRQLMELGAHVCSVRLFSELDTTKVGMDDFIVANGRDEFARHVIEHSEEFSNSKALHEFNRRFSIIDETSSIWDHSRRKAYNKHDFVGVNHAHHKHTIVETKELKDGTSSQKLVEKRTAEEWIKWKGRSECDTLQYLPGAEAVHVDNEGRRAINLWNGWGCEPKPGDVKPFFTLFDFITQDLSKEQRHWFLQWLAYPLQNPGAKMFSAVVVWSKEQGTGKSFIGHIMKQIYGDANFSEIGMGDLHAPFNSWLVSKQFIQCEEIAGAEDKRALGDKLKKMVTQEKIKVKEKYIKEYEIHDCANYYFTSNHPDALFLEDKDRRYFVIKCDRSPMAAAVYATIDDWKNSPDGPAALFDYLLKYDLSGFNPKARPPETEAKTDMLYEGKSLVGRWVMELVTAPENVLKILDQPLNWSVATPGELYKVYDPEDKHRQLQAFSKELSRSPLPLANGGRQVKIGPGWVVWKLYVVNGDAKLADLSAPKLAEIYKKEHPQKERKMK